MSECVCLALSVNDMTIATSKTWTWEGVNGVSRLLLAANWKLPGIAPYEVPTGPAW